MRVNGWISFFCVLAAIAVGTYIAIGTTDIATIKADWCDARPACLRDWVGALSGWAAAIGALWAAAVTLPQLKRQVSEAKRQTDFVLGDASPTLDVLEHLVDAQELVVRIVNWNRRTIIVRSEVNVDIVGLDVTVGVMGAAVDDRDLLAEGRRRSMFPILIPGWEDRSARPHFASLNLAAADKRTDVLVDDWGGGGEVYVDVQIVGEKHRSVRLQGEIQLRN